MDLLISRCKGELKSSKPRNQWNDTAGFSLKDISGMCREASPTPHSHLPMPYCQYTPTLTQDTNLKRVNCFEERSRFLPTSTEEWLKQHGRWELISNFSYSIVGCRDGTEPLLRSSLLKPSRKKRPQGWISFREPSKYSYLGVSSKRNSTGLVMTLLNLSILFLILELIRFCPTQIGALLGLYVQVHCQNHLKWMMVSTVDWP